MTAGIWKTYGPHRGGPVWIKNMDTPEVRTLRCTIGQLLGGRRWSLALVTAIEEIPATGPDTSPADPLVFARAVCRAAEMRAADTGENSLQWDHLTDAEKAPFIVRAYAIEIEVSAGA